MAAAERSLGEGIARCDDALTGSPVLEMARDQKPSGPKKARDVPDQAGELRRLKQLQNETEPAEIFDTAAQERLGKLISAAVTKSKTKKRR